MLKHILEHNLSTLAAEFAASLQSDETREGYALQFVGQNYAKLQAARLSETLITPDSEWNEKPENANSQNVFITGDNLEALRHLQHAYREKIKVIYIDPPYNTGKEFVYADKFELSDDELQKCGYDEKQIDRLKSLQGKSSHSAWLTFMYPRLKLAQKLLRPDGVIFVSIDDNEQAQLKLLCDEVFGEGNFVCCFNWQTKKAAQGMTTENMVVDNTEFIFVYAKNKSNFKFKGMKRDADNGFSNPDNDQRGLWKRQYLQRLGQGLPTRKIVDPATGNSFSFETPYAQDKLDMWIKDNRILFPKTTDKYPARKEFLDEYENEQQLVSSLGLYATKATTEQVYELFDGVKIFTNPKPLDLIQFLIAQSTRSADNTDKRENEENSCSEDVRERLRRKFDELAVPLEKLPFTPANFRKLFGRDGTVATPLGKVTIGKNQFEKLKSKEREDLLQAMYDTLTDPIIVIKEQRQGRGPDNLFVKSFIKDEQDTFITVMSVVAKIDGIDVSISTYQRRTYEVMQKINTPADIIYEKQYRQEVVPGGNGDKPLTLSDDNRLSILSANSQKSQEGNFSEPDIILDFFAGSGTTAHAVMQLNAEDGGNRKFIMVQLDEPVNETSEAKKTGYQTIDEISRERIKRAADKIRKECSADLLADRELDLGFKHYRLTTLPDETLDKIIDFKPVEHLIKPLQADNETILQTWLIDDGYDFNVNIETLHLAQQYEAYYIAEGGAVYLINEEWTTDALKDLLNRIGRDKLPVSTVILYGYAFGFTQLRELKTNLKNNLDVKVEIIERF